METREFSNPVLESLCKMFCSKFGEKEFLKACERARTELLKKEMKLK